MTKFLKVFCQAIEIARIVEAAVPLGGQGKAKLSFALDIAEAAYEAEEELRTSWSDKSKFMGAISRAIQSAVSLLNASGVFKRSTATA